jgi:hypothetical protein
MSELLGIGLVLVLLAAYVVVLTIVWQAPFRALGVLVAGMAFHNFLLMVLLRLNTPALLIRVVQAWKEGILLLLGALVVAAGVRAWRAGRLPQLRVLDGIVIAFTAVAIVYLLIPGSVFHAGVNLHQRLLGARIVLLIPLLYLFGRVFQPARREDIQWVTWVIVVAGAIVGLFGLVELWLIPTDAWLSWGVNQLSAWWGFVYDGPKGLPANFFQTTAEGFLLRRMVSTYVSPLGIAYAGLLVVPIAVVLLLQRGWSRWTRWLLWAASVFLVAGILFSLTRLALALMVFELLVLAVLFRRRWLLWTTPVVGVMVLWMLFGYVQVGPLVHRDLAPVVNRPAHLQITSRADPSLKEHSGLLGYDIQYVVAHPLGSGLGSSVHRFGPSEGTGESALFDMFSDMGLLGGTVYVFLYFGAVLMGARAYLRVRHDVLLTALPLVAFIGGLALFSITLTSDIWGGFAVAFLFWWAAGASVTIAQGSQITREQEPVRTLSGLGR